MNGGTEMCVREKLVELLLQEDDVCEQSECKYCGVKGSCGYYRTADSLIANGVTVQEWIPVTERLPVNIANRVLVVCERSNGVFYAHYEKPFWINLETDKPFISTVTHWMPIPQPPKGE